MNGYMRAFYYFFVAFMVAAAVIAAAFENIFGIWTPLLDYLSQGLQSYVVVYLVALAGVIAFDVASILGRKNKQDPS